MTACSWLFKQLVLQHRSLQTSLEAQGEEMKKREEGHKAEMTRVKEELDRALKLNAQVKKDRDMLQLEKASIEKERDTPKVRLAKRAEADRKIKKMVEDGQAETGAVKNELAAHKAESAKWLVDLGGLNGDMDRKLVESPSYALPLSDSKPCVLPLFNLTLPYLNAGEFTRFWLLAAKAVRDARAERGKLAGAPLPEEWDIVDHITTLKARIAPLKKDHIDLMNVSLRVNRVLFPEAREA